jgi:hypothetical protein
MKGAYMSKQETDKIKAEQENQIEDLLVDEAQRDEIKGGGLPQTRIKTFTCPSDPYGY